MPCTRRLPVVLLPALILAGMLCACADTHTNTVPAEVAFGLGRNIATVAGESGLSGFEIKQRYDDEVSEVMYELALLPVNTVFKYNHPGCQIAWDKVHAISLYANEHYGEDVPVLKVKLEHRMSLGAQSHAEVKALVDKTIAQFQAGKWQRYFVEDIYPRVTGRSSLLNEDDQYPPHIHSPDPEYVIPAEDWPAIASNGITWYWIGDGVRAWLRVLASEHYYAIHLHFEDDGYVRNIVLNKREEQVRKARERDVRPDIVYLDTIERNQENARRQAHPQPVRQARGACEDVYYMLKPHCEQLEARQRMEARALERGDQVVP